jgi:hypothetical protein
MTQVSNQLTNSKSTDYPQFAPGEKVRTQFGEVRTVWEQRGSQVFVVEEPDNASRSHETIPDCYRVKRDQRLITRR